MAVATKAGVRLTEGQRAYVEALRAKLAFALVVTSGDRTPESQADAMLVKYRAKGKAELRKVYRQSSAVIDALLAAPRTAAAWAAVIRARGMRLSRHLRHGAIDFRMRGLSEAQRAELVRAVGQTGGRAYTEYDHIHVDLPASYVGRSAAEVLVAAKEIVRTGARAAGAGARAAASATRPSARAAGTGTRWALSLGAVALVALVAWRWRAARSRSRIAAGSVGARFRLESST